ncbi:MAG: hypothetical protein LC808_07830 [Actinobacteria bacterium]|nr:hypothetical protein [Actinomycetota bacterium]
MRQKGFFHTDLHRRLVASTLGVLAAFLVMATPALAQTPVSSLTDQVTKTVTDPVQDLTSTVAGPVQTVTDTVTGTTDTVTGTTGTVTDPIGDAITGTGGQVADTLTSTGNRVGDTVGGDAGDAIKDATSSGGDAVRDTSATAGGLVSDVSERVGDTVGTGGDGDGQNGGAAGSGQPGRGETSTTRDGILRGQGDRTVADLAISGQVNTLRAALTAATAQATSPTVATVLSGSEGITARELAQAAGEAAKRFAFPLILMALVVGFVLLQNRMDGKDVKFALAPVSSQQDLLSFR